MIQTVTYFQVFCDRCGADAQADGEYGAWAERFAAVDQAADNGWLIAKDDEHYCPECAAVERHEEDTAPRYSP